MKMYWYAGVSMFVLGLSFGVSADGVKTYSISKDSMEGNLTSTRSLKLEKKLRKDVERVLGYSQTELATKTYDFDTTSNLHGTLTCSNINAVDKNGTKVELKGDYSDVSDEAKSLLHALAEQAGPSGVKFSDNSEVLYTFKSATNCLASLDYIQKVRMFGRVPTFKVETASGANRIVEIYAEPEN